jgi:hypothetical protein
LKTVLIALSPCVTQSHCAGSRCFLLLFHFTTCFCRIGRQEMNIGQKLIRFTSCKKTEQDTRKPRMTRHNRYNTRQNERNIFNKGARGNLNGWGCMLQAGRSRVQAPIKLLNFCQLTYYFQLPCYWGEINTGNLVLQVGRISETIKYSHESRVTQTWENCAGDAQQKLLVREGAPHQ